jgi:hypothetical protein
VARSVCLTVSDLTLAGAPKLDCGLAGAPILMRLAAERSPLEGGILLASFSLHESEYSEERNHERSNCDT